MTGRAEERGSRYRVEILVLTHLEGDQAPDEVAALEDFSDALDFLSPPPVEEPEDSGGGDEAASAPLPEADTSLGGESAGPEEVADDEPEPECVVVHVAEMGPEMQEAWRRLRLSGPFRPLQYLAWEQPGEAPFPELRIHDLEAVFTEDPWRDLREPPVEDEQETPAVFGDTVSDDFADEEQNEKEDEDGASGAGPLPSPIMYFHLDGTAQLVRTRFLHLALKVELREPVFDPLSLPPQPEPADAMDEALESDEEPKPTSFLVRRLEQRRQVKTGRMEYFDGPVLGVLAFVTDISDTLAEDNADE